MNVIFLDVDGVLNASTSTRKNINLLYQGIDIPNIDEEKIKLLAKITKLFNCKVVLSSSWKLNYKYYDFNIDEYVINRNVQYLLDLFIKYDIDFYGFTPNVKKNDPANKMWKEDDIRLFLWQHPEIEHFVVIDDEDYDLKKLADYLVKTKYISENIEEEGLCEQNIPEIEKKLKLTHKYKKTSYNSVN